MHPEYDIDDRGDVRLLIVRWDDDKFLQLERCGLR
jgi:hypothetical protein